MLFAALLFVGIALMGGGAIWLYWLEAKRHLPPRPPAGSLPADFDYRELR